MWQVFFGLISDVKKIGVGLWHTINYARRNERIYASISLFTSDTTTAKKGELSCYKIIIYNQHCVPILVNLVMDIYKKEYQIYPEDHYACFEKKLYLRSNAVETIIIKYDWMSNAVVEIDGVDVSADKIMKWACGMDGWYQVQASLFDEGHNIIEKLCICQELR